MADVKLPDLDFDGDLPDGFVPVEAVVVLTGMDADGDEVVHSRATPGLMTYAAIGLLTVTSDRLRSALLEEDDEP